MKAPGPAAVACLLAVACAGTLAATGADPAPAPAAWAERLQLELAALDGPGRARVGVYVRDLETGVSASHHAEQRWYLASMVKLPVAIAVLRGIESGQFAFDTTLTLRASDYVDGAGLTNGRSVGTPLSIRHLLEQMIIYSDNTATDMLIGLVGLAKVNALVESLVPEGFQRITGLAEIRRRIYGQLVPNADRLAGVDLLLLRSARSDAERLLFLARLVDAPPGQHRLPTVDAAYDAYYAGGLNSGRLDAYGELLALLADGKALTPGYTDYLLELLERVATGTHRLKAGLPPDTRFAHKTGTQRRRVCDAGLVRWLEDGRQRRVAIVACTRDARSLDRAESTLMQVGSAVCRSGLLTHGVTDAATCRHGTGTDRQPAAPRR